MPLDRVKRNLRWMMCRWKTWTAKSPAPSMDSSRKHMNVKRKTEPVAVPPPSPQFEASPMIKISIHPRHPRPSSPEQITRGRAPKTKTSAACSTWNPESPACRNCCFKNAFRSQRNEDHYSKAIIKKFHFKCSDLDFISSICCGTPFHAGPGIGDICRGFSGHWSVSSFWIIIHLDLIKCINYDKLIDKSLNIIISFTSSL